MGVLDSGKLKQNQDTAEVTILSENKQPKQKKKTHTHCATDSNSQCRKEKTDSSHSAQDIQLLCIGAG